MRSLRPVAVLLVALAFTLTLRPAEAKGNPIPPARFPELTSSIFNPTTKTERAAALLDLFRSPRSTHADVYGKVLGPVFLDKARIDALKPDARREMHATVIAHLADMQPEDGSPVLLVRHFLPWLARDPELLELLRAEKLLTRRGALQKGWSRILAEVRNLLGDDDVALRRSAVRISAHCDCVDEADTLAALYEAAKKAEAAPTPEDEAAYVAAAERLLQYRFADLSALLKFLGAHTDRFAQLKSEAVTNADRYRIRAEFLEDVIRLYRSRGGAGIRKAREAAIRMGQAIIEKAEGPSDLLIFFDPENERFAELQRAAMAAAAPPRMKPAPDGDWAGLLVNALKYSEDAAVLERVMAIIGETFTQPTKATQQLAAAIAHRIRTAAAVDTLAHRRALARSLGRVGTRRDVRDALPRTVGDADAAQKGVWYVLIRAFGIVENGLVVQLTPYYRAVGNRRPPQWARLAVAEALGLQGFYKNQEQGPAAGLMLHHILTGQAVRVIKVEEENGTFAIKSFVGDGVDQAPDGEIVLDLESAEKEDDVAVIAAAIKSLEDYETENAARVVGDLAAEGGEVSDTALKILGRQLSRGSVYAARALARLLETATLEEPRLLAVLEAITQANAPTDAAARSVLTAAVRGVMDTSTSAAVRSRAAGVAVHLADVESVMRFYLTWKGFKDDEPGRQTWKGLLQKLVVAIGAYARNGEDPAAVDRALYDKLRPIANEGRGLVLELLGAMGQDADRFDLKHFRADLRYEYSTDPDGRTRDVRREDLDTALGLYRGLVAQASSTVQSDIYRSIYNVLVRRAEKQWLAQGEKPEVFHLDALKAAADSRNPQLAQDALDKIGVPLKKQPGSLSDAQKGELDQTLQRLRSLIDKANGK